MNEGVLDEDGFLHVCHQFLQRSDELRDGWSWESVQGYKEGYLRKNALRLAIFNSNPVCDNDTFTYDSTSDQQEPQKDKCVLVKEDEGDFTVNGGISRLLQFEYHILYACSYNTPVLYFRASTLEGMSLSLEDMWSSVHPNFRPQLYKSPLNTITQQEHPLLGQPFFMLHPCRTQEFMRPVLQAAHEQNRQVNYILVWLSVVGPLVGLNVPLEYSTPLHPASKKD